MSCAGTAARAWSARWCRDGCRLTAFQALFRIHATTTAHVERYALFLPPVGAHDFVERCLLHTDPIYNTVEQKSRWQGTKFRARPGTMAAQLEDLKLRDELADPRDNKSWQIR